MSTKQIPFIKPQYFDGNGDPLSGGKLYSYVANTSTPAATYVDYDGLTPNTNPVVLDSEGRADIWIGTGFYKFVLTDADDVQIWSVDNVSVDSSAVSTTPWTSHTITDGQAATALSGETLNAALYTSALWDIEIIRGTTVIVNGQVALQNLNGTIRVKTGTMITGEAHGLTFSVSQVGQVGTLQVAASVGPGNGTIKMRRTLIAI